MSAELPPGRPIPATPPPADGEKKKSGCLPGCLVILAIAVVLAIGGAILGSLSGDDDYDSNTSYEAIAQCEAAIEERLKAPSTAEFNSTAKGYGTWTVTGTVDAENSFGAMIRSSYQCTVIIDNEKDTARVRIDSFE